MIQDIKQNINKVDFELKQLFENVYISDKTERGNFLFSITANKMFLFEGCKKRVEVKVDINKNDLNGNVVKWSYSLNPLNENAERIEKVSYIQTLAKDIYDIDANKRMVKEYFNQLEAHVDLICENSEFEAEAADALTIIMNIYNKYGKYENLTADLQPDSGGYIILKCYEVFSMSDKFRIESELKGTEKVAYVSFNDALKEIKITL